MPTIRPPRDEAELSSRLALLVGRPLSAIAAEQGVQLPVDLRRNKGLVGQLLERALGATAASRSEPDFPALGIELKTVPVDARRRPLESCFVASLELGSFDRRWETSGVKKKLARVAWVAIDGERGLPLAARRCQAALIWSPTPLEATALQNDYEEIVELYEEGFGAKVTGHRGAVLQLRPKGKSGAALRWALDEEGATTRMAPRAFYLRAAFTGAILAKIKED